MVNYQLADQSKPTKTTTTTTTGTTAGEQTYAAVVAPDATQNPPPMIGGYEVIAQPMKNSVVMGALSFLIKKVNRAIRNATLVRAEIQVVAGCNIKLSISFDTSSPAFYLIVVYEEAGTQNYQVTSVSLENVASTPNFKAPLSQNQLSTLLFLNPLNRVLAKAESNLITAGTELQSITMNYPYFRLVLRNQQMSRLEFVVKY